MKRLVMFLFAGLLYSAAAHADFVILHDGRSYSGVYTGASTGKITFTDSTGIQYTFPVAQVQSLVFSNVSDHVALRNGQSYAGHLTGVTSIHFRGSNGIGYVFPLRDVSSLVITTDSRGAAPAGTAPQAGYVAAAPAVAPMPQGMAQGTPSVVVSSGTQIVVRTDAAIDTATDQIGKLYPAQIAQDVVDSTGSVGISSGTQAELQVIDLNQGTGRNPDLALALHSVSLNGTVYRVDTSSVTEKNTAGFGMNKRTAVFTGGGAGLGTMLGAIFGGGKGAGIGALAGGGAGALTQYLARGKRVKIPAEATLTFQLERTLVLHP